MLNPKIMEFMELELINNDEIVFTDESKELLSQISQQLKEESTYKHFIEQSKEYGKDMTAEDVYMDMMLKICAAPTKTHIEVTIKVLLPIINDKLFSKG